MVVRTRVARDNYDGDHGLANRSDAHAIHARSHAMMRAPPQSRMHTLADQHDLGIIPNILCFFSTHSPHETKSLPHEAKSCGGHLAFGLCSFFMITHPSLKI